MTIEVNSPTLQKVGKAIAANMSFEMTANNFAGTMHVGLADGFGET